jgi:galactosyl transferase GMA12/MNN10 family
MLTIVTLVIGHDFKKGLHACLESKRFYAAAQGYDYREGGSDFWDRSRPIPWSKVPYLLSILETLAEGAIVWLSDADVLITNPSLTLEEHVLPLFPEKKDILMTIDACGHLNSGNMFLRNTPWLRNFWRRVGEQTDLLYHIWWENAAIIKLLEINPSDLEHVEIISDHTRFNSYLQGLSGEPLWKPGHFLVHFAGVYNIQRIEHLIQAIQSGKIPRLSLTHTEKIEYIE